MDYVPARDIGDRVRVMDTTTAKKQKIANKRGVIVFKEHGYVMKEDGTGKLFLVNGSLLAGI